MGLNFVRLKLDVGVVASTDLAKEGETANPRFPMVGTYNWFVAFAHSAAVKNTGLPTMPYIVDSRDVEGDAMAELQLPSSWDLKKVVYKLFTTVSAPHLKLNMDNLVEVLKSDWRKGKPAKYSFPVLLEEGGDDAERGEGAGGADADHDWDGDKMKIVGRLPSLRCGWI